MCGKEKDWGVSFVFVCTGRTKDELCVNNVPTIPIPKQKTITGSTVASFLRLSQKVLRAHEFARRDICAVRAGSIQTRKFDFKTRNARLEDSRVMERGLEREDKAKLRHFREETDAALANFERAQEWADLIRDLQRLQRILNKYSQLTTIPDTVGLAKRLHQCLNPALPSGVHLTTLQTYELIFSRIGPTQLARDLAFYSEGIFDLYRHASYQVKPVLLDLFERHFVTLGQRVVPCLPGLVPSLLAAMEDVGSEFYHRAIKLLDELAADTPISDFMSSIWVTLLRNAAVRLQALHYVSMRFPGTTEPPPQWAPCTRAQFCPDAEGTVLCSLIVALHQGDTLVRRTALDLIVSYFPLSSREDGSGDGSTRIDPLFNESGFTRLLRAALELLQLREWALTRRVLLWVFQQPTPLSSTAIMLELPSSAKPFLLAAVRSIVDSPHRDTVDVSMGAIADISRSPFLTLSHILDVPAFADAIASDSSLLLRSLQLRLGLGERASSNLREADRFYFHERLPPSALWRACTNALLGHKTTVDHNSANSNDLMCLIESSTAMLCRRETGADLGNDAGNGQQLEGASIVPSNINSRKTSGDNLKMLMDLLSVICDATLHAVRNADDQRTLLMLRLYHNLLLQLRQTCVRVAAFKLEASLDEAIDKVGDQQRNHTVSNLGLSDSINLERSSTSNNADGRPSGVPSTTTRERVDTVDEAQTMAERNETMTLVEKAAATMLDGAMSALLPTYSLAFGELVSSVANFPQQRIGFSSPDQLRLHILRLANRLMLVHLRLSTPVASIPWGKCADGDDLSLLLTALENDSHVVDESETISLAASTFAVSPFEISRAPASALSAPPVKWSSTDDEVFFSLLGTQMSSTSMMRSALAIASEYSNSTGQSLDMRHEVAATKSQAGDSVRASCAASGSAMASRGTSLRGPLRESAGEGHGYIYPQWLAALLEGCRSNSFHVVSLCAPTLAFAIDGGRGELSLTQSVMVLRELWRFLGDEDGSTQHAAAFLWIRMQRIWPHACAAVLAHEIRTAQDAYAAAELGRQAALAESSASTSHSAVARAARRASSALQTGEGSVLAAVLAPGASRLMMGGNDPTYSLGWSDNIAEGDKKQLPEIKAVHTAAAYLATQIARFSLLWRAALLLPRATLKFGGSSADPPVESNSAFAFPKSSTIETPPRVSFVGSGPTPTTVATVPTVEPDGSAHMNSNSHLTSQDSLTVAGVGLPLALDSLSHPSAVVRGVAQRWVLQVSRKTPSHLQTRTGSKHSLSTPGRPWRYRAKRSSRDVQ